MMSGKMYRFRPDERLDPKFLEFWLLSPGAQKRIDAMKTGTSDSGLNLTHERFLQLPVPVPPLDKQHHIVHFLEDQLSRLDASAEALGTVERRTVAIEESWLRSRIGAPNVDETHRLGDLTIDVRGGWSRSSRHLVTPTQGLPYLKMNNLTRRGRLDLSDVVHVAASGADVEKFGVRSGDVLFNSKNSGDLIGKTALANEMVDGSLINENIMRLRFSTRLLPEYVAIWFLGPVMRSRITAAASASTNVAAVYQKDLVGFPIWVPPLEVQAMVANEFEVLRSGGERLSVSSRIAQRQASGLRRSLLAAAFGGRPTTVIEESP